ncbi:MAG: glycosyltransferase family 2 protein [Gammaproteobacteria bacterium]|nr:glycosyltransferase family 2 protein [Gammaproteobacteria bacterium]
MSSTNDNSPHVSIGMPVYNGERWIRSAIGSILTQDYRDLELIISDNASTDATEDICREIITADPRVRYYRNVKNLGVDANYNRVVQLARGCYFKWTSSNDLCAPQFISKCVGVLERRPDVVLCYPRTQLIIDDSGTLERYVDALNLEEASPCTRFRRYVNEVRLNNVLNGVIRTETLRQTGLLRFHRASDYALVAGLAVRGKFVEVPEFLFFRRMTPESATKLKSESELNDYYRPERGAPLLLQQWKLAGSYLDAVRRAPVGLSHKLCLYRYLARRMWWIHPALARELCQWFWAFTARAHRIPN